ncbi:WD40/YVTN/BNR-like repeat-containing protein [Cohnella thailandensis]|uniref:Photosynthesis system II assembly factor Ycf48/Hcf136-like domain-containing protein n=1 Tax=Cohnella thailandensis TaxID=557557 RepID=A0A841SRJ5_9BACL|nr:hypothetical protein [Cohnella thailandensis]MBB6633539.1 hypothetical protein [Cohnella thailandensis]MBP1974556.1 photosystem II stability/assembly factor-like uncharacterized protein [Cohnella thailandensis]
MRKYARLPALLLAIAVLAGGAATVSASAPTPSPSPSPAPSTAPSPAPSANPSPSAAPAPSSAPSANPSPSAAPAPSAAPEAKTTSLKLKGVQFVDSEHGWTFGTSGDDKRTRVWRTTNGGSKWTERLLHDNVREASFAMANNRRGWAVGPSECREESGQTVCSKLTILNTRNGGESWSAQWTKEDPKASADNEVAAVDSSNAFVRTGTRIWRTENGGRQWTDVSLPNNEAAPYRISFPDERTGYAAGRLGTACPGPGLVPSDSNADCRTAVWKTKDGGRHWSLLSNAPKLNGEWTPVDIQFINPRNGFLLLANPNTHGSKLYHTSNGGISWQLRNQQIPGIRPYPVKLDFVNAKFGYVPLSVGAGPVEGGLLHTKNGGSSFAKIEDPRLVSVEDSSFLSPQDGWVVAMNPRNPSSSLLLGTTDSGRSWRDLTPK